jgi:hydrogenase maturation protease
MIGVVGCGNPNRSDDGVGPEVVRALRGRSADGPNEQVRLIDAGTDGMAAMFAARGCRSLIIVDACRSGSAPGAIFEIPGCEVERSYAPTLNLHDFRWDNALHAGRKIFRGDFPSDVAVLLVEAQTVEFGIGLSPVVFAAAAIVVERIETLIRAHLQTSATAP